MSKQVTTEDFIKRARDVHGDRYDYSKSIYTGCEKDIEIICHEHGPFWQMPSNHLKGKGCRKCGIASLTVSKRVPFDKFLEEAKLVHGDKYEYFPDTYRNRKDNISIRCKEHDFIFQQSPMTHLRGAGCSKCANRYIPTTDEFITHAMQIHGDKYAYDRVIYKNAKTPVEIFCKSHNTYFMQTPDAHLVGKGCKLCAKDSIGETHKHTTESYIEFVQNLHGDKYDYSDTIYTSMNDPITVMCKRHKKPFTLTAIQHKTGMGCPLCKSEDFVHHNKCTTEMFIQKAIAIHGLDKYGYDKVVYGRTAYQKVDILCKKHDIYFSQTPHNHLAGNGCPICHNSYSALQIIKFCEKHNIPYNREYRFDDCRDSNPLPFDFAIFEDHEKTKLKCLIEYDGEQHYIEKPAWGGAKALMTVQLHDAMKNQYCEDSNIRLLRIPYWEKKHIISILEKEILHI